MAGVPNINILLFDTQQQCTSVLHPLCPLPPGAAVIPYISYDIEVLGYVKE